MQSKGWIRFVAICLAIASIWQLSFTAITRIQENKAAKYAQEQAALDPSIDFFVFGHQHKPMQYPSGDHALTTVVGNWIYDFTYAVFDGETMELKRFE